MSRKNEIIDAEFTQVEEAPKPPVFNLDDVAEMVMVGRKKDGTEFVQAINFNDALKAKMYADYAITYYQSVIEQAVWERRKAQKVEG